MTGLTLPSVVTWLLYEIVLVKSFRDNIFPWQKNCPRQMEVELKGSSGGRLFNKVDNIRNLRGKLNRVILEI